MGMILINLHTKEKVKEDEGEKGGRKEGGKTRGRGRIDKKVSYVTPLPHPFLPQPLIRSRWPWATTTPRPGPAAATRRHDNMKFPKILKLRIRPSSKPIHHNRIISRNRILRHRAIPLYTPPHGLIKKGHRI